MAAGKYKYKAICKTPCFWQKQYWGINKEYSGWKKPPIHFEIIEPKQIGQKEAEDHDELGSDEQEPGTSGSGTN